MNWINNKKIILASKSPRRAELLGLMDIPFSIKTFDTDESFPADLRGSNISMYIAKGKALAVQQHYKLRKELIIGADTMVFLGDEILEKPKNDKESYRMLAKLSGKKHEVITGVCLLLEDKTIVFSSKSSVLMRPLDHKEIVYYIDHYRPFDKAGSYAIQEWIGMNKISHIEGSYSNIMGLPTDLLYEALKALLSS